MGWQEYYARRDALDAALEQGELRTSDAFPDTSELLAALHHRWTQRLNAQLELAELEYENDPATAITTAWHRTKQSNPTLHALLTRASLPFKTPELAVRDRRVSERHCHGSQARASAE